MLWSNTFSVLNPKSFVGIIVTDCSTLFHGFSQMTLTGSVTYPGNYVLTLFDDLPRS